MTGALKKHTIWQGNLKKSKKRGFITKREADEWLRNFLLVRQSNFDMQFEDFLKLYDADTENRLREQTMRTKKYIVDIKIQPFFGNRYLLKNVSQSRIV